MAFPEAIGDQVTGEEMEGKTFPPADLPPASGPTIAGQAERAPEADLIMIAPDRTTKTAPSVAHWVKWCLAALAKIEPEHVQDWLDAMEGHLLAAPADAARAVCDAANSRMSIVTVEGEPA